MSDPGDLQPQNGSGLTGVLQALVPGRLRRPTGNSRLDRLAPFLQILVEEGVSLEEVTSHQNAGRTTPRALENALLPLLGKERLLGVLATHYQVAALDLEQADVSPHVAQVIPPDVGTSSLVACAAMDEEGLTLAMVDPSDESAVNLVEARTDFQVKRRVVVLASELNEFQELLYGTPRTLKLSPRNVVDDIIRRAIEQRASDIHIEPMEDGIRVRFRKDGVLIESYDLSDAAPRKVILKHLKSALPVVVKNKSGASGKTMNIAENQKPQDGRIYMPGRNLDMRVSILPTVHGESIVIRVHSPEDEALELRRLGFSDHDLDRLHPLIELPYGILLVSGPTGSGKTTTLYTVLRRLNDPGRKILTVEDPIEYTIPGVMQVQTNPAKALTFAEALRSFLRHDPDIIMVGEIRDRETAVMAVEASLTGHLVLSTIHANDAVRTVTRVKDLGISPLLINSTLLGTLAQRLVRTNCPKCRDRATFSDRFYALLEHYGIPYEERDLCAGRGCPHCNYTGYQGRTGIYELMLMTPELRSLILEQVPDSELEAGARRQGMRLLIEDALSKAAAGITTEAEVLRVTNTADPTVGRSTVMLPRPVEKPRPGTPDPVPRPVAEAPAPAKTNAPRLRATRSPLVRDGVGGAPVVTRRNGS